MLGESTSEVRRPSSPEVKLGFGNHPTSTRAFDEVDKKLESGDLTASVWDLKKESELTIFNPGIIAIDGVMPNAELTDELKIEIWKRLPKTKTHLNKSGSIKVIAGDTYDYRYLISVPAETLGMSDAQYEEFTTELGKRRDNLDSIDTPEVPSVNFTRAGVILLAAGAFFGTVDVTKRAQGKKYLSVKEKKTLSRRAILKLSAALAGAAMLTSYKVEDTLPVSPPMERYPLALDEDVPPYFLRVLNDKSTNLTDVDGRTAILIEKSIDASKEFKNEKAAVIAGGAHEHNGYKLYQNPSSRKEAIVKYTNLLLDVVDEVAKASNLTEAQRIQERINVLDFLAIYQIYNIKDPGTLDVESSRVNEVIGDSIDIDPRKVFTSQGVKSALKELRDKESTALLKQQGHLIF